MVQQKLSSSLNISIRFGPIKQQLHKVKYVYKYGIDLAE